MSPEQEGGQELDHLTDLFSLGVTLYEALAGNRPSIGAYSALSAANEAIPVEIDNLIQDCLLDLDRRVESADIFNNRLTAALTLQRPLSEVLAQRPLYEMILALRDEELTTDSLAALPEGQKALILVKLESIISSDDESLSYPSADLLEVMLAKGVRLPCEDYQRIVRHAIVWAFDKIYPHPHSPSPGRRSLQEALADVCLRADREAHRVLREEIEQFIAGVDLGEKQNWYLHALREVLSALLANTAFTTEATTIASFLNTVNVEQQSRQQCEA